MGSLSRHITQSQLPYRYNQPEALCYMLTQLKEPSRFWLLTKCLLFFHRAQLRHVLGVHQICNGISFELHLASAYCVALRASLALGATPFWARCIAVIVTRIRS
jgi:hypothetical protein